MNLLPGLGEICFRETNKAVLVGQKRAFEDISMLSCH
jgi:hypothetical protein